jgi:hypothetical protein
MLFVQDKIKTRTGHNFSSAPSMLDFPPNGFSATSAPGVSLG